MAETTTADVEHDDVGPLRWAQPGHRFLAALPWLAVLLGSFGLFNLLRGEWFFGALFAVQAVALLVQRTGTTAATELRADGTATGIRGWRDARTDVSAADVAEVAHPMAEQVRLVRHDGTEVRLLTEKRADAARVRRWLDRHRST